MLSIEQLAAIWTKLVEFSIVAVTQAGLLVLWVLIFSVMYSGLERIFPRLGGPPSSRTGQNCPRCTSTAKAGSTFACAVMIAGGAAPGHALVSAHRRLDRDRRRREHHAVIRPVPNLSRWFPFQIHRPAYRRDLIGAC